MNAPKLYLAHSARRMADGKVLQHLLETWGYEVVNPFDYDTESRQLMKAWGDATRAGNKAMLRLLSVLIYAKDRRLIQQSDAVVNLYLEESTGAANEMAIAYFTHKPLFVLTDLIHPFIEGQAVGVYPIDGASERHPELRAALERHPRVGGADPGAVTVEAWR